MPSDKSTSLRMHLGETLEGNDFSLPLSALRRHLLVLGGTGSGKTVLCKAVVEESIRYRLPVIAVDLQGDILSLAKQAGMVPDGAIPPLDITRSKYAERLDVKIWSPGSTMGIPVSFAPDMRIPYGLGAEARLRAIGTIASDVAAMLGDRSDASIAGIHAVIEYADHHALRCDSLDALANLLANPPALLLNELDPIMPKPSRTRSLRALAVKRSGINKLLFSGDPIDVYELFGCRHPGPVCEGRARLSIVYLAHLAPDEQQLFLSLLFSAMYRWMLTQGGSLAGLLYVDEIAAICPPVAKPPAKAGLLRLLRQARKYGLCAVLGTQHPSDLDLKALGQISTLALGRLGNDAGLARVTSILRSVPGIDAGATIRALANLKPGEFMMVSPDNLPEPTRIQGRWLATEHRLVTEDEIRELVTDEDQIRLGGAKTFSGQLGVVP